MTLFRAYRRLVAIRLRGRMVRVPENNYLLRCFQYLCPRTVPYGAFCWNEECQNCRVHWRQGGQGKTRIGLSCKLLVREGMEITELAPELESLLARVWRTSTSDIVYDPEKGRTEKGREGSGTDDQG
ncbi:MAG: 2Fe-2S iron-sulfur cluster-binding protein [Terriglobales bacterium]